jgi:hypothetical protein
MRLINITKKCPGSITVDWLGQVDNDGFTEFKYQCKCGRLHFDVYINKGLVSQKYKVCKDCKYRNIVPCRTYQEKI